MEYSKLVKTYPVLAEVSEKVFDELTKFGLVVALQKDSFEIEKDTFFTQNGDCKTVCVLYGIHIYQVTYWELNKLVTKK